MAENSTRKTFFILALAVSLVVALIAIIVDQDVRDKLGPTYYILGLAIIGSVLLVLAGYVWDRTLIQRLRTLRTTVPIGLQDGDDDADHDEIIGLARNIERMAQALQKT